MLARLGVRISRTAVLRVMMALPSSVGPAPAVLSVDDFALRRGRRYATLLLDAVTHRRVDVLPDRKAATLAAWLREHPEVEVVCRDGSAAYAEAIRDGAPQAVQVSDRWHLWHNLAKAVEKVVVAHSGCWHQNPPHRNRPLDERTRQRHAAVHALLDQGVGLLECARRLGWALNTVKRYARAAIAEELQRPPRYRRAIHADLRRHYNMPFFDGLYTNWEDFRRDPARVAPGPACTNGISPRRRASNDIWCPGTFSPRAGLRFADPS
ncbi:transposase [Micromonospora sp. GCM10011541]|uniref:transposase n=1 Tax=Micromonospora TaxID=1873 RepID=UPI0036212623